MELEGFVASKKLRVTRPNMHHVRSKSVRQVDFDERAVLLRVDTLLLGESEGDLAAEEDWEG